MRYIFYLAFFCLVLLQCANDNKVNKRTKNSHLSDSLSVILSEIDSLESRLLYSEVIDKTNYAKKFAVNKRDSAQLNLRAFHSYINSSQFDNALPLIDQMYLGEDKDQWENYSRCYYYARSGQFLLATEIGENILNAKHTDKLGIHNDILQYLCISHLQLGDVKNLKINLNKLPEEYLELPLNYENEMITFQELKKKMNNTSSR